MKAPKRKSATTTPAPVFQIAIRKRVTKAKPAEPKAKPPTRDKIFSKSRDTREDRGARQMKTAKSSQTFSHGR